MIQHQSGHYFLTATIFRPTWYKDTNLMMSLPPQVNGSAAVIPTVLGIGLQSFVQSILIHFGLTSPIFPDPFQVLFLFATNETYRHPIVVCVAHFFSWVFQTLWKGMGRYILKNVNPQYPHWCLLWGREPSPLWLGEREPFPRSGWGESSLERKAWTSGSTKMYHASTKVNKMDMITSIPANENRVLFATT